MYPSGARYAWEFKRDDQTIEFQPTGPIALDDHELMVQAALGGVGLAYVWENRAEREIADGRLIRCLGPWCAPENWLYLYYPTRKYISTGLRAVIEAMRA
jgi:DNA-binding transcriptional LysR family regulator